MSYVNANILIFYIYKIIMVLLVKIIDGYKSQAKFVSFYLLLYSLVISVNIFIVKYILDNTYYYCDERSLQYDCDFSKTFYDANEYLITGSIISGVIFGLIIIIRSKDIIKSISVIIYTIIYGISINSNGFYQSYSKKYPTIDIGKAKFNSFLEKQITTFGEFLSLPFTLLSILLLLRVGILVWEKVFAGESYHLSRDFDVDKYPKIKDEKTINSVQTSNTNNNYVSGYENNNLVTEAEKSVEKIDDDGFISRYKYLLEPDYNYIIFDGFKFIIKIMIFHFLLYSLLMFINYKILDIIYENTYFVCEPKSGRYNCYLDPILYQATDALIWTIIIIGIITLVIITLRSK
ncbi:MAG: hypothetical protein OEZ01_17965, partial [Candidatus Heimdallarchaeota archaeon]|nr:hypothetical protein [Candidatus Heimdallarchaeota archaeon]